MKSNIYWIVRHAQRGVHDLRFAVKCWWLSHHIDFVEWRMTVTATLPQSITRPVPATIQHGGRYAVRPL